MMAGDTRDAPSQSSSDAVSGTKSSTPSTSPQNYDLFTNPSSESSPSSNQSPNGLPAGSGQNTAGSKLALQGQHPSIKDGLKTVRLADFKEIHMYPCVRESLLTAIGGGFGIGGTRAVLGARIPKAANWAVGSFLILGVASFEYCQYKRVLEKAYVKRAVEVIDANRAKQESRIKERRKAKEEAEKKAEEEARSKSWKFW